MKLNLGNVEEQEFSGFTLPENGWHTITVKEAAEKPGQAGPYFAMKVEITNPTDPANGSTIFVNMSFAAKALPNTKHILRMLSFDVDGDLDLTPAAMVGRRADVLTEQTQYNSKATPERASEVRTKAEIRKWAMPGSQQTVTATAKPLTGYTPAPAGVQDDDDIPF